MVTEKRRRKKKNETMKKEKKKKSFSVKHGTKMNKFRNTNAGFAISADE
jgi:hypothetical protein